MTESQDPAGLPPDHGNPDIADEPDAAFDDVDDDTEGPLADEEAGQEPGDVDDSEELAAPPDEEESAVGNVDAPAEPLEGAPDETNAPVQPSQGDA